MKWPEIACKTVLSKEAHPQFPGWSENTDTHATEELSECQLIGHHINSCDQNLQITTSAVEFAVANKRHFIQPLFSLYSTVLCILLWEFFLFFYSSLNSNVYLDISLLWPGIIQSCL